MTSVPLIGFYSNNQVYNTVEAAQGGCIDTIEILRGYIYNVYSI